MSCGVGRRRSLDPALLWLWCKLAATALIRPLAWESPYAMGVALEKTKRPKKKKKEFSLETAIDVRLRQWTLSGYWRDRVGVSSHPRVDTEVEPPGSDPSSSHWPVRPDLEYVIYLLSVLVSLVWWLIVLTFLASRDVGKKKTVGGNVNWCNHYGGQCRDSLKH